MICQSEPESDIKFTMTYRSTKNVKSLVLLFGKISPIATPYVMISRQYLVKNHEQNTINEVHSIKLSLFLDGQEDKDSMKIKEDYVLRNIAGSLIVVPVGEQVVDFKGIMTLNSSGGFIWKCLSDGITYEDLLGRILEKYDIDTETAQKDLDEFILKVRMAGALDE